MRAGQKNLQLQAVQLAAELRQVALQIGLVLHLFGFRLAFGQFDHDAEIIHLAFGLEERFDFSAQAAGLVNQALGFFAIVPERLQGHQARPVRPAAFARPARQRNLRKWANFSPAADNCALIFSNITT